MAKIKHGISNFYTGLCYMQINNTPCVTRPATYRVGDTDNDFFNT